MQDEPDRDVLLEAIARFVGTVAVPDPAVQFRLKIAAHLLGGLAREGRTEAEADAAHLLALGGGEAPAGRGPRRAAIRAAAASLATRVRQGELDAELGTLAATLREVALAKARIGDPRFK